MNPTIGEAQREKLAKLRANRDCSRGRGAALEARERLANGTENLVPIMVECVEARVTLGEISHRLRGVWGEQRQTVVI